ncbi:MAG: ion channel [Nanoarchaeota archaeon]
MKMNLIKKIKNEYEFKEKEHKTSKLEKILIIIISISLIISLISQQFIIIPAYLVPFFIFIFLIVKLFHIFKKGGTLLEDYTATGVIIIFLILYLILGEKINATLVITFILILFYSTGLIFWVRTTLTSKKIVHFLISYLATVIMIITLFAGAYSSGAGSFTESGKIIELDFGESIYFSTVTFTTVGYGDISPLGVNRFFAAFEALIGVLINVALIGYLLSAGRNNENYS